MYRHEQHKDGYYIHRSARWKGPDGRRTGLVMREEMEFREEQEEDFIYQVARWVHGKGYEVLYYTSSRNEANRVYCVTLSLESLNQVA